MDASGSDVTLLFVQTAAAGTLIPRPLKESTAGPSPPAGADPAYLLSLSGHPGQTVYFSDRPERVVGVMPTGEFLDALGFDRNPPNAALVTDDAAGNPVVVVLTLRWPAYDAATGMLTYEVILLEEYEMEGLGHLVAGNVADALPERFAQASLFIDACDPASPYCKPY